MFDDAFSHKLTAVKNAMTAAIVTLFVLAFLCIPYETLHFGDGGTVITNAIAYSVVDWNRGNFFPHNFKSYRELWEMKH